MTTSSLAEILDPISPNVLKFHISHPRYYATQIHDPMLNGHLSTQRNNSLISEIISHCPRTEAMVMGGRHLLLLIMDVRWHDDQRRDTGNNHKGKGAWWR